MNPAAGLLPLLLCILTGCDPPPQVATGPPLASLSGHWKNDSTVSVLHNQQHQFLGRLEHPTFEADLNVGPNTWDYDGIARQYRWFTHDKRTFLVLGRGPVADTVRIVLLTAHHLVVQDSTTNSGDYSTQVWKEYYSR